MIPGKRYSPGDIAAAAWRRRWWFAVPFVALSCAALAFALSLPHNFRSLATVQVLPEPASNPLVAPAQTPVAERLASIGKETLTRDRLERIITDLNLYPKLRRSAVMEDVVAQMRTDITFQVAERDVFHLGFTSRSPETALTVANRLTALFLEENARNRSQRAEAATEFLAAQLNDARATLEDQERRIEAYRTRHAGELPSQLESNVQELNNSQLQLRTLVDSINRDRDQRLLLQRQIDAARARSDAPAAGGGAGREHAAVAAARAELRAMELRLTPEHPDIQRAKRTLARLEQRAADDRAAAGSGAAAPVADPRVGDLQAQIDAVERQLASRTADERALRARIADYTRRVDAAPTRESELVALTRDYDDTKRLYSSLLQRQQEAAVAANLERKDLGDRFRVIEPARLPEKPFSPSRRNYFLMGLLAALGLSLSLAAVVEYRDNSLRTEEDVAASLRLPVLATIPVLNRPASGRAR